MLVPSGTSSSLWSASSAAAAPHALWARSLYVCPNCGYHMPIGGYYRLSLVLDHGSFRELDADLAPQDVLHFPGYREKLAAAQNKTGLREAAVTATGRIGGVAAWLPCWTAAFSWAA